ncbi:putative Fe(2+)-trafficking protein [Candidatus Ecksteinia adelgidicola]|nr:putative Fe(2+)-trafficking protein [Candidatus Ecksteinia adelgidicola]
MNCIIFCTFLQCNAEKQDFQIYPGNIGKRIFNEISKVAWNQWIKKQTILINKKKLTMENVNDRKFLEKEMIKFLFENHTLKTKNDTSFK